MNSIIEQMLKQLNTQSAIEKKNAIKEVVQEIVLSGLSRAGFFKLAAFYGGTALRIFYGLDRFSEDLDFSLKIADPTFRFSDYLPVLEKEIRSYGLNFVVDSRDKTTDSTIQSAFLKGNTEEHILMFYGVFNPSLSINPEEKIKVKFEVDVNPPDFATFETRYRLLPLPYEIVLYDAPSLFAGKIHAVLCRAWKNRVKGRDLYDFVFYITQGTTVNLKHLSARLVQSGYIPENAQLTISELKEKLRARFLTIDYAQAKQDVLPFIKDARLLDLWSPDFFIQITESLK